MAATRSDWGGGDPLYGCMAIHAKMLATSANDADTEERMIGQLSRHDWPEQSSDGFRGSIKCEGECGRGGAVEVTG
jgi:hypothetical protein